MSRQSIIVSSKDRTYGTITKFYVEFKPVIKNIKTLRLEQVVFPFSFNNVTNTYGNSVNVYIETNYGNFDLDLVLPISFLTTVQLLEELNNQLQVAFSTVSSPSPAPNISPITFLLDDVANKVNMMVSMSTYNVSLVVISAAPSKSHVLQMLGLPNNVNSFPIVTSDLVYITPFTQSPTANLPISSILIQLDRVPSSVITTTNTNATFAVEIKAATLNGNQINLPNEFRSMSDYYNEIMVANDYLNFQMIEISLLDEQGNLLTDQVVYDWTMKISYTTY